MSRSRSDLRAVFFLLAVAAAPAGGILANRHLHAGEIGASCTGDVECRSHICSSGQCEVRCSTNAGCPTNYRCTEKSTDNICVSKAETSER